MCHLMHRKNGLCPITEIQTRLNTSCFLREPILREPFWQQRNRIAPPARWGPLLTDHHHGVSVPGRQMCPAHPLTERRWTEHIHHNCHHKPWEPLWYRVMLQLLGDLQM